MKMTVALRGRSAGRLRAWTWTALLMAVALPASARWELVTRDAQGSALYIRIDSIRYDGDTRRFWALEDLRRPDRDGDLSYRILWETDCSDRRVRPVQTEYFSGPMAGGERTGGSQGAFEWAAAAPGTPGDAVLKIVCVR
ncbi:MAG: hypothetical protein EBU07_09805 [Betaproteobacteria bacterium]|jgi:hypothetical protein|nr:hypothetical protein [Betaproteobacteria bacterium]NBS46170.1 hypothetical protein [Betaproteobacteria bacterium]